MWNTDICWSFQMDFKATSIYICRWMVKALYRLFFQYNVNVLGFQNMLHVYDVKRFFLLCSAIRGCLKNSIGKWRYSVKQLERWKFYNKRNMHMCCAISIVWKCPVFYVHDFICEMQGLKHFMQFMKYGSGAVPFQFHILLATLKLELNCPIKIPFKNPPNYLHMS